MYLRNGRRYQKKKIDIIYSKCGHTSLFISKTLSCDSLKCVYENLIQTNASERVTCNEKGARG